MASAMRSPSVSQHLTIDQPEHAIHEPEHDVFGPWSNVATARFQRLNGFKDPVGAFAHAWTGQSMIAAVFTIVRRGPINVPMPWLGPTPPTRLGLPRP